MKIALLQLAARFGAPDDVLARAREMILAAPTDLVVFSEAALTGYVSPRGSFDLSRFAEPASGQTSQRLARLAREANAYVAAPLIEKADDDALFNAFQVFDRQGQVIATYRKRHPWYPETWATPGDEPYGAFEVDGQRAMLAVCFDLHFLETEASRELDRASLLVFPSAWVEEVDSRQTVLSKLAHDHQVAIANANWAPGDVRMPGQGGSMILDASGGTIAVADQLEARVDGEI